MPKLSSMVRMLHLTPPKANAWLILSGSSFIKGDTINNEYINQIPESDREEIKDEIQDEIEDVVGGEQEEVDVLPNKPIIFIYLNPSVQTKNYYYGNS